MFWIDVKLAPMLSAPGHKGQSVLLLPEDSHRRGSLFDLYL